MPNPDILNYIQTESAKGLNRNQITDALIASGWRGTDIEEAFGAGNSTSQLITEKDYPITTLWVFKVPIVIAFISIVAIFFGYYFPYLLIALPIYLIANPIIRHYFHYSIGDKFFEVKQGVFSKKQRNLPYGVIQNVLVKQDWFDRVFGLASLRVENASSGGQDTKSFRLALTRTNTEEKVGASGNQVNIPGLKKKDAETLRDIVLKKMKENPIEDSQSGL